MNTSPINTPRSSHSRPIAFARSGLFAVAAAAAALCGSQALADVELELRASPDPAFQNNTIQVELIVRASDPGTTELISAIEVILGWDPALLQLTGSTGNPGVPLSFSGFPTAGSGGLNEANPPADGDGYFVAFSQLGNPIVADDQGVVVQTFQFQPQGTGQAVLELIPEAGDPLRQTRVLDGTVPNTIIPSTFIDGSVLIRPFCFVDIAEPFGVVNILDVVEFITIWNALGSLADYDLNGIVNIFDVVQFITDWNAGCD